MGMSGWGLPGWLAALSCFGMVAARLGRRSWVLDLFSHFRAQYAVLLSGAAIWWAAAGAWPAAIAAAAGSGWLVWSVVPLYRKPARAPDQRPALRVAAINVLYINRAYLRAIAFIRQADPDLAVIAEVDAAWMEALRAGLPDYSHVISAPRDDGHGLVLLSRLPLETQRVVRLGKAGFPSVEACVSVGGHRLTVLGTHPFSPLGGRHFSLRNEQLAAVACHAARLEGPRLVVGDLNCTSWSPVFGDLLETAGLRDSRLGFGIQPTWPSFLWPPLRIPIDHCLVSPEVTVLRRMVGRSIGSDHLPVVLECAVDNNWGQPPINALPKR